LTYPIRIPDNPPVQRTHEREDTVKLSKIIGYAMPAALLFVIPGYIYSQPTPPPVHVKVANCTADPETAKVSIGQDVVWDFPSDGHKYSADFPGSSPFAVHSIPGGQPLTLKGTFFCSKITVSVATSTALCYFPYTLSKDGGKPCNDPGVRVVPPSKLGLVYWVVALIGLSSYVVFRIRARNRLSSFK